MHKIRLNSAVDHLPKRKLTSETNSLALYSIEYASKIHLINQKWNNYFKSKHILIFQIEDIFFAKYCVTNYSCINAVELPLWIK